MPVRTFRCQSKPLCPRTCQSPGHGSQPRGPRIPPPVNEQGIGTSTTSPSIPPKGGMARHDVYRGGHASHCYHERLQRRKNRGHPFTVLHYTLAQPQIQQERYSAYICNLCLSLQLQKEGTGSISKDKQKPQDASTREHSSSQQSTLRPRNHSFSHLVCNPCYKYFGAR